MNLLLNSEDLGSLWHLNQCFAKVNFKGTFAKCGGHTQSIRCDNQTREEGDI